MNDYPYTCKETCGQEKHCGNRYCSAHPKHFSARPGKEIKKQSSGKTADSPRGG